MEAWISWTLGYILIGLVMAFTVEGINKWHRLIFIVWPLPLATFVVFLIYAIIKGVYTETKKFIQKRRNKA